MSAIHWLNAINGSFTNTGDWGGGVVPGPSDDAILDAVGSSFTVTSGINESVRSVQLASNATLSLTGGGFNDSDGTGSGANAGIILIGAGATMWVGGDIDNIGTIALAGEKGAESKLAFYGVGHKTLTGGGEVILGNTKNDSIRLAKYVDLYNEDNIIIGSGMIAGNGAQIHNESGGVIDADSKVPLTIDIQINNDGLIEATGSGNLTVHASLDNIQMGPTGVVLASDNSVVYFDGGGINGGTLKSTGSGRVVSRSLSIFSNFTNDAVLVDLRGINLLGSVVNSNVIMVGGGSWSSNILVRATTLSGRGTIALEPGSKNHIGGIGQYANLTNVSNTIVGTGLIAAYKYSSLTLVNEAAGLIDANNPAGLTINTLSNVITNAGTIEASGSGIGVIDGALENSGTLSAIGGTLTVNATVTGPGIATIDGGTLDFTSNFNEAVTFIGMTGVLGLAQSDRYSAIITGFSATGGTSLDLGDIGFVNSAEATYSGTKKGGVLTVTDGTHTASIRLAGNYLGSTFVASSDGHGGTDVVSGKTMDVAAPPHAFISAMAGFGASAASLALSGRPEEVREAMLSSPRMAIA